MDARAKTVREILHSGDQYLVPFFQRNYSWEKQHWERLRDDLESLIEDDLTRQHFLGPLVCTPHKPVPAEITPYQLIDGQQRLTTLNLLLAAIRDVAKENDLDALADEVMEDYLLHKRREGLQRYKIIPRLGDREVLIRMIEGNTLPADQQAGMAKAYRYYRTWLRADREGGSEKFLRDVFTACTARLSLVVITIDGENPYEIFESLNSTGLSLEEADLIRNFIFMQVPLPEQDRFNDDHWQPFEALFDGDGTADATTSFYRNYLMRNGDYSKSRATFVDFKSQAVGRGIGPLEMVQEMQRFARYDQAIRQPASSPTQALENALNRFAMLDVNTAAPLLMHLMDQHESGALSEHELLGCIQDIESFVLRRSICGESTRGYGRWLPAAIREITTQPRQNLQAAWLARGWPDDAAFIARLTEFPIYRRELKKCRLLLEMLEKRLGHQEPVDLSLLTIEHVLPQSMGFDVNGQAWRAMLGANCHIVHQTWVDTLGNLTLTGYNREMSNRPFADKQRALSASHVELNRHFHGLTVWDEQAIRQRGQMLALRVAQIWPRPAGVAYRLPVPAAPPMAVGADAGEQVFTIRQVGIYAKMVERDGQFVVLAGSTARRIGAPTWAGTNRQQQLLAAGKLVVDHDDTVYRFAVDVPFDAISGASALVLARHSNGNVDWRVEGTTTTYQTWKRQQDEA